MQHLPTVPHAPACGSNGVVPLTHHGTHRAAPLVAFHRSRAANGWLNARCVRGRQSMPWAQQQSACPAPNTSTWPSAFQTPTGTEARVGVDVIAITDRAVILLEVKNWGGDVLLQNNDLVQQRLLDKGEPPKPVIEKLRAKVRMLQRCSLSIDPDRDARGAAHRGAGQSQRQPERGGLGAP